MPGIIARVDVLVGGQYGSEGKGNLVGHLASEYDLPVRFGGPNAGHKVFDDPVQVYYHLPSGSGVPVSMISTKFGWSNVIDRRNW